MKSISSFVLTLFLITSCQKEDIIEREYPRLNTSGVTNITSEGARFNASLNGNYETITDYGFVWGFSDLLTVSNSEKVEKHEPLTSGEFTCDITYALLPMKDYYVRSFVKSGEYVIYGNSVLFKSLGSQAPQIIDFYPKSATWGDTITISGKNFSFQSSNNLVYFGINGARPIFSSDTQIKIQVPDGLSAAECTIAVETYGNRCYAIEKFTLITPVQFTGVSKSAVTWGDTLMILGDFQSTGQLKVLISDIESQILSLSSTTIEAIIPGTINYTDSLSIKLNLNNHFITAPFKVQLKKPFISSLEPSAFGWDDTLCIRGLFNPATGSSKVYFSGIPGSIISSDKEKIVCVVPSTTSHSCSFYARVGTYTLDYQDTISLKGPEIIKAIPATAYPGQYIQLKGKYFKPDVTRVSINDYEDFTPDQVTSNSLNFTVSDYISSGPVKIKVTVYQKSVTSSSLLNIVIPKISDFSPKEFFYDDIVTIAGQGFNPENLLVRIGESNAQIIDATSSQIRIKVPYNAPAAGYIYVISNSKELISDDVYAITQPVIQSLSSVSIKYGDIVSIYGNHFNPIAEYNTLYFGSGYCEIVSASTNEIKFKAPVLPRGNYNLNLMTGGRGVAFETPVSFIGPWSISNALIREEAFGNAMMFNDALLVFGGVNMSNYYQRFSFQGGDHQVFINAPLYDVLNGVVFNIGGIGYYGLGHTYPATYYKNFYRFDPGTREWTRLTDFPGAARRSSFYFSIDDNCYVGSGTSGEFVFNDLYVYNTTSGTWTRKGNCPFVSVRSTAFVVNDKAYIIDGKDLWLYSPQSDSWTRLADFPGKSRYFPAGFVLNGYIYYGTGTEYQVSPVSYSYSINDFWKYNPATNVWENVPDCPINIYGGFGVSYLGKGYLGGGYQLEIIEYDPSYE